MLNNMPPFWGNLTLTNMRLTPAMRRVLLNLREGRAADHGLLGSYHGGHCQVLRALLDRHLTCDQGLTEMGRFFADEIAEREQQKTADKIHRFSLLITNVTFAALKGLPPEHDEARIDLILTLLRAAAATFMRHSDMPWPPPGESLEKMGLELLTTIEAIRSRGIATDQFSVSE